MSKMTKIIGVSALGLGIAVSIPVLAHEMGTAMHDHKGCADGSDHKMMHSGMMPKAMKHSEMNVEQHLGNLRESLELTTEQHPVWERFEQAVKTMASNKPMTHAHGNHGPDSNMEDHFARMEQHMGKMKKVFEARKALYETLTEKQKETMKNSMPGPFSQHG
jgi:hypothetical protein